MPNHTSIKKGGPEDRRPAEGLLPLKESASGVFNSSNAVFREEDGAVHRPPIKKPATSHKLWRTCEGRDPLPPRVGPGIDFSQEHLLRKRAS